MKNDTNWSRGSLWETGGLADWKNREAPSSREQTKDELTAGSNSSSEGQLWVQSIYCCPFLCSFLNRNPVGLIKDNLQFLFLFLKSLTRWNRIWCGPSHQNAIETPQTFSCMWRLLPSTFHDPGIQEWLGQSNKVLCMGRGYVLRTSHTPRPIPPVFNLIQNNLMLLLDELEVKDSGEQNNEHPLIWRW